MKNEKEIIICVGLGVMVVDTAEDAAAVEIMDGAGIAVEITEEIPIGEVSTMVMQSAIGMAMMPEETASLAAAAAIMAAVAAETREGDSICTRCELRERKPGGESCPAFFPSVIKNSKNTLKIGATGFEPATSRPPAERATKLRHTPKINHAALAKCSADIYRHLLKYYMHDTRSKVRFDASLLAGEFLTTLGPAKNMSK